MPVRRGFTLIELLVVLAIMGILVGIILPALAAARAQARTLACQSRLRQIGLATLNYAHDHRSHLPRSSHSALAFHDRPWGYVLCPYLGQEKYEGPPPPAWWPAYFARTYRCPQDGRQPATRWSYGKNVYPELTAAETADPLTGMPGPVWPRLDVIPQPAALALFGEIDSTSMADHVMAHFWPDGGDPEIDAHRHGRGSNYLYADGHVVHALFTQTYDPVKSINQWNPATAQ